MSKLYPPDIGGVIPSFYGEYINIPFTHNKLANDQNIYSYSLVIKSVNNKKLQDQITTNGPYILDKEPPSLQGYYIHDIYKQANISEFETDVKYYVYNNDKEMVLTSDQSPVEGTNYYTYQHSLNPEPATMFIKNIQYYTEKPVDNIISFNWPVYNDETKKGLRPNMYYKVQVAYIGKDGVGYYSDVAVVRYTSTPTFNENIITATEIIGTYSNEDQIEKVSEYKFDVKDGNILLFTSGWQLHNNLNDINKNQSMDKYIYPSMLTGLQPNHKIIGIYTIKTVNGMEVSHTSEVDTSALLSEWGMSWSSIEPVYNSEMGSITINCRFNPEKKKKEDGTVEQQQPPNQFILQRFSNKDNYLKADMIHIFDYIEENHNLYTYTDYTIAHGYLYRYCLYGYYTGDTAKLTKNGKMSETTIADQSFDDIFLADQNRQLKVKYNPKISSFKTTVLESKIDTIGGNYPFFFRNKNIGYKEFPISGLISYLQDDEELFISKNQLFFNHNDDDEETVAIPNLSTNLTNENILAERIFKTEVLDWLNNGKPKLFRSPTEGNFIVRLMNVSLSPNDTLGRMLHTFSATAYEIAECTPENLRAYNVFFEGRQ